MFRYIILFCIAFSILGITHTQNFAIDSVTVLQDGLVESSGLLYRDGVLITHNDSGDGSYLYEIDTLDGSISRTVFLSNTSVFDWEDLAADDTYLYIGDFGNNFGTRTDLVIHRLHWEDYWQSDTVTTERIEFSYAEQTNFEPALQMHPFDAESLVVADDALYLFTKDWTNFSESKVYRIPKDPGNYTITAVDSINTPGLLTGLAYHEAEQKLLFVGYNLITAFVMELSAVDFNDFSSASVRTWNLPIEGSFKTEAISYQDERFAYLSKERNSLGEAVLYRLDTDFTTSLEVVPPEYTILVFPNPVSGEQLYIQIPFYAFTDDSEDGRFRLLDMQGRVHQQLSIPSGQLQSIWQMDVSDLPPGAYFYEWFSKDYVLRGRVVVE